MPSGQIAAADQGEGKRSRLFATASFCVAVALAFTAMYLHEDHDIAAGVCMVVAQFLLLTASIIGIDYKLNQYGSSNKAT